MNKNIIYGNTKVETYENIKPLGDLILIEYETPKLETQSGIITKIKSEILDRPTQGRVIAIGPEVQDIEVGDTVVFEAIRGQDLDSNHMFLGYKTILGILKN